MAIPEYGPIVVGLAGEEFYPSAELRATSQREAALIEVGLP